MILAPGFIRVFVFQTIPMASLLQQAFFIYNWSHLKCVLLVTFVDNKPIFVWKQLIQKPK